MKTNPKKLEFTKITVSKLKRKQMMMINGASEFPCEGTPTSPADENCPQTNEAAGC